jgi:hypothetical protein
MVRLVHFMVNYKSRVYRFKTFDQASCFLEKLRLKRRCRGVLGDRSEYDSELRWENIPDVLARIVDHDGGDLIPNDSSSIASRDGIEDWVHSSWSSSPRTVGATSLRG